MTIEERRRAFLKANLWEEWRGLETDQRRGMAPPPPQQPYPEDARLVPLVSPGDLKVGTLPLIDAIRRRTSCRRYSMEPISLEELSFLLWATQGVREVVGEGSRATVYRTVPSGGARHPFETYLVVDRVSGLEPGLYRYLSLQHRLCLLRRDSGLMERFSVACDGQAFVAQAAAIFIWTAIPYRDEWRYSYVAPKMIALDAGHVCQNLYLATEAIGAGTCAVGRYLQSKVDAIVGVDGTDEFSVYVAVVGKVA